METTTTNAFVEGLDAVCDKIAAGLQYIGEQFGMALNWSGENILPYIKELMTRFVRWEIFTSIIWIIIMGCAFFVMFAVAKFCNNKYKKAREEDSYYEDDWQIATIIMVVFTVITGIICFCLSGCQIFDIVEAICLPEKTILEYAYYLMQ